MICPNLEDYSTYTGPYCINVNDGKLEYNENINSYMPVVNQLEELSQIFLKATESILLMAVSF